MDKPFKTYDEQIHILADRGVEIETTKQKSNAKKLLQREGYYNLINGYSKLFLEDVNMYKTGTTMEEIFALYKFDIKLREIFLKNILHLETNIKSLIAYYFPKSHPEPNYLIYENFNTSKRNASSHITSLFAEIQKQIASHATDPSISHYLTNYGYLPIWVLNNILTMGTISKFYSLMIQSERQEISKIFHLSDNELESILFYVSKIRNFCAHGNRLYCYRCKTPLSNFEIHSQINNPNGEDIEYTYGKRDLFACVIGLKYTLSKSEFKKFIEAIDTALKNLKSRISVISIAEVLLSMGFPSDWKQKILN